MDFLKPHAVQNDEISAWMTSHYAKVEDAFKALASIYDEQAAHKVDRIRRVVAAANGDWTAAGTLRQRALRALRSTSEVSCVLDGMRRAEYVSDVIAELQRPVKQDANLESWTNLTEELSKAH